MCSIARKMSGNAAQRKPLRSPPRYSSPGEKSGRLRSRPGSIIVMLPRKGIGQYRYTFDGEILPLADGKSIKTKNNYSNGWLA